jgi:hypothetical protein
MKRAVSILLVLLFGHQGWAQKSSDLPEAFVKLYDLIKPQKNESLYAQVPWPPTLWEARIKAAAEGKPLFIWVTGGPPGGC